MFFMKHTVRSFAENRVVLSLRPIAEATKSHKRSKERQEAAKLIRNEKVLHDKILFRKRKNYQLSINYVCLHIGTNILL